MGGTGREASGAQAVGRSLTDNAAVDALVSRGEAAYARGTQDVLFSTICQTGAPQ